LDAGGEVAMRELVEVLALIAVILVMVSAIKG
jgi:hypothetical protein